MVIIIIIIVSVIITIERLGEGAGVGLGLRVMAGKENHGKDFGSCSGGSATVSLESLDHENAG